MIPEDMKLISVDDHVIEHGTVWKDRVPSRFRDRAPHVVEKDEDKQVWIYEGREYPSLGLDASVGRDVEDFRLEPRRYTDMRPGCYDPKERVKDMDADGVWAQTPFPSFPRFCGQTFLEADDRELALLCVRAYNDFILDEWCAAAPGRFIPVAIVPLWDPQLAAEEAFRVAEKGARAISFSENPSALGLPSWWSGEWGPLFAAAEDTDMPLCLHFGSSSVMQQPSPESPFILPIALAALNSMATVADLIFSPIFRDHPKLKVAISEGGIGWMPYVLERCNWVWSRHRYYEEIDYSVRPSDIFREHIWGCFITDDSGLKARDTIGVQNIMWECDYPHSDSVWPNSRPTLERSFEHANVDSDEARLIAENNARQLFNWPG